MWNATTTAQTIYTPKSTATTAPPTTAPRPYYPTTDMQFFDYTMGRASIIPTSYGIASAWKLVK